ncbi:PREDICTED: mitochondrial import inner membrane translocase subunit TIM50-like [Priapulus caudatus]|uniref:Mitochondrial import inner membrane translocase subunit TIM50 n=1 Tax=Priapulus caudatus TaxID=37621 RepID=A0ABM1EVS1_PRICU|nr:PREDICTED: mitochondrial import inner membrane translocase subunit TIM50-like [Priapulus caudatus]
MCLIRNLTKLSRHNKSLHRSSNRLSSWTGSNVLYKCSGSMLPTSRVIFFSTKHEDAETTKKSADALVNKLANAAGPGASGNKDTENDEEGKRREKFAKNMRWTFASFAVMFSGLGGMIIAVWGAPKKDEEGHDIQDEYSNLSTAKQYLFRAWSEARFYEKMIREPSRDKLLPDPLTEPYYQPKYTLVLEMTGILVHPDWTYGTGWRFKKRPGIDYFLQQVGPPLFEVVIYTQEQGFTAFPIIDSLDPQGYIMYRLFRDATRYIKGHHVKDLSCLNRDMSKVIVVDWNSHAISLQPRNALQLKKWGGNDDDRTLFDLGAFLRTIAVSEVEDVREVLDHYKDEDDPIEAFKRNQRLLQEQQAHQAQQMADAEKQKTLTSGWSRNFLGSR